MKGSEDLMAQRKAMQQRVLEIIGSRSQHYATKKGLEALESKLNAPYPSGVVWHYDPVDWRMTEKLRKFFEPSIQ